MMGQAGTSVYVYDRMALMHRYLRLFMLVVLSVTLTGCSMWQGWFAGEPETIEKKKLRTALHTVWQITPGWKAADVSSLMRRRGLLTPVLDVLPDGEFLPDYVRSARLYDGLSHGGLRLVSGENTWKWYYRMIAAVEQSCPAHATDPLASCRSRRWFSWLPGFGLPLYDRNMVAEFLQSTGADYLVVSDPGVYESESIRSLRYAASSLPMVQMSQQQRYHLLAPVQSQTSIAIIKIEKSRDGSVNNWNQVVARCAVNTKVDGRALLVGSPLSRERADWLKELHGDCVGSVQELMLKR